MSKMLAFFAKVEGSVHGFVNPEELFRSIITALGSGSAVGLLILVLQAILSNVVVILPNPAVASLASMVLTLILDLLRRQNQGTPASPAVVPAPTPVVPATPAPAVA